MPDLPVPRGDLSVAEYLRRNIEALTKQLLDAHAQSHTLVSVDRRIAIAGTIHGLRLAFQAIA